MCRTNRAAALTGASCYTGYAKQKKKAVSLTELNGQLVNKLQLQFNRINPERQYGKL
jgi:hypothetical protein